MPSPEVQSMIPVIRDFFESQPVERAYLFGSCSRGEETKKGMRHVLVHGYYEITPDKVWAVISKDLPLLKPKIEEYLREEQIIM